MRSIRVSYELFSLIVFAIIFTGCNKDKVPGKDEIRENYILQFVNEISSDSLRTYVEWLQNMNTRFMLASNHKEVAYKIKNKFIRLGYPETRIDSFLASIIYRGTTYNSWQYNIVATLDGISYPDSICILGAHYDNIITAGDPFVFVPGANDNASGVAATLEIARLIKKHSFSPASTIQFVAFAAEELGLFGSKDFAEKANNNNKGIKLMLNNDMIAYHLSPSQSTWIVNIIDYADSPLLRADAERLCARYTILKNINDNAHSAHSDSYPFSLYGYKSLFFSEDILENSYHTVNDLTANCNFNYCREIAKISCAMLLEKNYME